MKKRKIKISSAFLLSLIDYTVIQIGINNVAQQTYYRGEMLLTWIFQSPGTLEQFIIWLGLLMLRLKSPSESQRHHVYDWIIAVLLSLTMLLGNSVKLCNSFMLLYGNRSCLLLTLFSLIGLSLLLLNALSWLKLLGQKLSDSELALRGGWNRHPFLFPFVVLLLLWLPYAIVKYPGGIDFDSYLQLLEPMGLFKLSNHWPIASSYFFASCFYLGRFIFGSNNAGLFTIILCTMLIVAGSFAYSFKVLWKLKVRPAILELALAIVSLATIYSRFATSMGKDNLFASMVLLFVSILAELLLDPEVNKRRKIVALLVVGILVGITRSNGPHTLLAVALGLLIYFLFKRKKEILHMLLCTTAALLLCLGYSNVLLPSLGIANAGIYEALSIPFMQTARYVTYYADEVTAEEEQAIDAVLKYDELAERYKEKISDNVKWSYRGNNEALKEYFKVWLKMGLKHPEVYLQATFNNIYGYICPGILEDQMGIYMQYDPVSDADVQLFSLDEAAAESRSDRLDKLTDFILAVESSPIFFLVCSVAINSWAMLYMILVAIGRKKPQLLILLLPSLITLMVCIAGPTFFHNGLRYALPVIFVNPFMVSLFTSQMFEKKLEENNHAF
jgi:hypothetical protein